MHVPTTHTQMEPTFAFGIGPHLSGVPFHMHGPGFSEVVTGAKRWFLFHLNATKAERVFDPAKTSLKWLHETYPSECSVLCTCDMLEIDLNYILYLPQSSKPNQTKGSLSSAPLDLGTCCTSPRSSIMRL